MKVLKYFNMQGTCFEEINNRINQDKQKKIILVTGASSSGKGYFVDSLKKDLESKGKKIATISADMYYKGLARIIVEKAFLKYPELVGIKEKEEKIKDIVRNIIIEASFPQKFCDENISKLQDNFKNIIPQDTILLLIEKLKYEKDNINFDEPFAIDFESLKADINTLINNKDKKIIIPHYSFRTAELEYLKENSIKGSDYDNIIVEGLYTLRKELLEGLNEENLLKMALNCDLKSILIRRFNRDIKTDRCTFTPEQTIMAFITNVMPAFYNYILPTFSCADIMYNISLTKDEIKKRQVEFQVKYKTRKEIFTLLKINNANLLKVENHKDYFLEDTTKESQNNIIVRIREKEGQASKLTIKIEGDKLGKAIEEYDLDKYLSVDNKNIKSFIDKVQNSGYEITEVIEKERFIYDVNGVVIKVDNVKGLGYFVEIDKVFLSNINQLKDLKNKFLLDNNTYNSYYEMFKDYNNFIKTEMEKKYLIWGLKEEKISKKFGVEVQKQYYLNKNQKESQILLNKAFKNLDVKSMEEARVRMINGKSFELCLKGKGDISRDEVEKEVYCDYAQKLINKAEHLLEKNRYKIFENPDIKAFIDFYKVNKLCKLEIEYDPDKIMEKRIDLFAKSLLNLYNKNAKINDVTRDLRFKNSNLVKELGSY